MVVVIGSVRSWLFVPQPLVVVENIGVDQFAAAYGVFAVVSGAISVVFGPFSGEIYFLTLPYLYFFVSSKVSLQPLDRTQFSNDHFFCFLMWIMRLKKILGLFAILGLFGQFFRFSFFFLIYEFLTIVLVIKFI